MKPFLIIIGLGNQGAQYERTRHNVGFWAMDHLAKEFGEGEWKEQQKFASIIQEGRLVTFPILLAKPTTYMNNSGEAARKMIDFYKLDPRSQILVICDDIDLPLGEVRLREKGGPGTHNGLRSLVQIFGEEFPRIRIGLGEHPTGDDLSGWVLSVPPKEDEEILRDACASIPELIRERLIQT